MLKPNIMIFFFFFQAEDGIRDKLVTGVQTCALPISFLPLRHAREEKVTLTTRRDGHDTVVGHQAPRDRSRLFLQKSVDAVEPQFNRAEPGLAVGVQGGPEVCLFRGGLVDAGSKARGLERRGLRCAARLKQGDCRAGATGRLEKTSSFHGASSGGVRQRLAARRVSPERPPPARAHPPPLGFSFSADLCSSCVQPSNSASAVLPSYLSS